MKGFNIRRNFYSMASKDGKSADINMYGDVVETWPTDFWSGKKLEGNYIVQDEFLADLDELKKCENITIHISSYGGDCGVGFVIHNKLRELATSGVNLVCIVDGVAMSAASVIMCAADTVRVNPSSLVMVHRCWSFLYGGYNAEELRQQAESQESYDKAIVAAYRRKTGLSDTILMHMMSDTTYMTGKEAVEKGFADELLDAEPLSIAASADGRSLFMNGKEMHLAPGMFAPDFIPTVNPDAQASVETDKTPVVIGSKGGYPMTKEELRAQYPEQVAEVEAEARASVDNTEAINAAVQAERDRLSAIDEVAPLFDAELVHEAKYGENPCSAAEMTLRAAQSAAKKGSQFLADVDNDTQSSGANGVKEAPPVEDGTGEEDVVKQAKADARAYNERHNKEVK